MARKKKEAPETVAVVEPEPAVEELGPAEEIEPEAEPEAAPEEVLEEPVPEIAGMGSIPLATLSPGQEFEFNGDNYRLVSFDDSAAQAKVMFLEWAPSGDGKVDRYTVMMPADTLVNPK